MSVIDVDQPLKIYEVAAGAIEGDARRKPYGDNAARLRGR
jgi:hypothetical protein